MTGVSTPTPARAGSRSGRWVRRAFVAAGAVAVLLAIYALILKLIPPSEVDQALLGPAGPLVAFIVGAIAFFSPCILPLVPGYLSFVSGLSSEELEASGGRRRVLLGTVLFVLGFSTMFTLLSLALTWIGGTLAENQTDVARVGGVVVILMGLAYAAPRLMPFLERERRPLMSRVKPGVAGAFPLGLAFAVGWTPCAGPALGTIITLGAAEGTAARTATLMFSFCLGFGMWFVLTGLGVGSALRAAGWVRERARTVQLVGGLFMIVIGVLLVTNLWEAIIAPLRRMTLEFSTPL